MANKLYEEQHIQDIADAIREVNGKDEKYLPSEMGDTVRSLELLKYATTLQNLFNNAVFPDDMLDIKIDALNLSGTNNLNTSFRCTNLHSIRLYIPNGVLVYTQNAFYRCFDLEYIEFPNGITTKQAGTMFYEAKALKKILGKIDVSNCTSFSNTFKSTELLEEVYFVENTIKVNLSFAESPNLIAECVQSIIDGLADLTGLTTQTITFHTTVKAKLTETQIATITSKNRTLA